MTPETALPVPAARPPACSPARPSAADDDAEDVSTEEVIEGIRTVAARLGSPPERLLMVDYQQESTEDDDLPALTEVFAAFGSWKRARREAAVGTGDEAAA